jgi:mRNA-degrading endonuclease toxin of MazEF toxin-antitoxin module
MNRGDVVLVNWIYSDLTGSKLRPAVVVQADFLNGPSPPITRGFRNRTS